MACLEDGGSGGAAKRGDCLVILMGLCCFIEGFSKSLVMLSGFRRAL